MAMYDFEKERNKRKKKKYSRKTNHDETSGERAVKAELNHLNLNFIQEKEINNLKGDTKKFRQADFYLPDYDVYIEFLGNWNTNRYHKERYEEKMRVYELNDIKCIWIYPNELTHTHKIIQKGLLKYKVKPTPVQVDKPIVKPERPKKHHCNICGRAINHEGNCWPCNTKLKKQRAFKFIGVILLLVVSVSLMRYFGFELPPLSIASQSPGIDNTAEFNIRSNPLYKYYKDIEYKMSYDELMDIISDDIKHTKSTGKPTPSMRVELNGAKLIIIFSEEIIHGSNNAGAYVSMAKLYDGEDLVDFKGDSVFFCSLPCFNGCRDGAVQSGLSRYRILDEDTCECVCSNDETFQVKISEKG